jgi:hypothetical protein
MRMSSKIFDLPRHKRPLWEVFAFAAALVGLVGLALVRDTMHDALTAKESSTPSAKAPMPEATAGFSTPE